MSTGQLPTARLADTTARTAQRRPLVLDRYRLHRRLGAGAFGAVWAAHDERLEREVAVKIIPRGLIVGGRFEREARAAARLAHPGIVTLHEAVVDDEGAYLVSELVHGATLEDLLNEGSLSDRDILAIGIALCDALAHAHSQGVVHRDVKPSNVLVPDRPSSLSHPAKLTDFGVARVIGGDSLTRTGDIVGTAAYMAPEQAEGREAGPAADLYALALVMYEALTGVNPIRTGTAAMRARRLGAHLPPLRRQRRDFPRELGRGVDQALRPRARERGGLDELRDVLSAAIPEVDDTAGVVESGWLGRDGAPQDAPELHAHPLAVDRRDGAGELPLAPADPTPSRAPWPPRGLAAVAAAGLTAWLAVHLLAPSPISPAATGMLAGALVLVLPRVGWLLLSTALTVAATVQHRPGGALAVLIAAALPVVLLPRRGSAWPLAAVAPALGIIGLAGSWPAIAAHAKGAWRRAALGLTGWMWLALAAPLAGVDLYARRIPGTPAPDLWTASLSATAHDVLAPLLRSGIPAAGVVWALAALVLPWLVKGTSLALDGVRVIAWAATVVALTEAAIGSAHAQIAPRAPTVVLGAVASAIVALSPTWLRALRRTPRSTGPRLELP